MQDETVCDECGNVIPSGEGWDYHDKVFCSECYDSHFPHCVNCGERYDEDEQRGAWGGMCESCSEEHFICEECGNRFHNDDYGEDGLCINCNNTRQSQYIHHYHGGPEGKLCFHQTRFDNINETLYFGVELETEEYSDRMEAAEELHELSDNEQLFWLEEDCSLEEGIEIITQPCTLEYHKEEFPWGKITAAVHHQRGKAFSGEKAALHIHSSLAFFSGVHSELYQLRLIYLGERFRQELLTIGRTTSYLADRSAQSYHGISLHNCPAKKKISELKQHFGRLQAVNLKSSQSTIEFRFFRSSLSVPVILAYLELVDFLVRTAKGTNTKKLHSLPWADILKLIAAQKYQYLPQLIDRVFAGQGRQTWREG